MGAKKITKADDAADDKKDDWAAKKFGKKAQKACDDDADDMDKSDDGDDEEEDDDGANDMSKKAKKSLVTAHQLSKALEGLGLFVKSHDPRSRKEDLLSKAQSVELDDDERAELFALLGKSESNQKSAGEQMTKSFSENETLQKSVVVNDFLQELVNETTQSCASMADMFKSQQDAQNDFNLLLAKSVASVGQNQIANAQLLKAISERMGIIEAQPAREPKSVGARPLQKSFAGAPEQGAKNSLNKSQVLKILGDMLNKSHEEGRDGLNKAGTDDILKSIAKYETTNTLSAPLEAEVIEFYKSNNR